MVTRISDEVATGGSAVVKSALRQTRAFFAAYGSPKNTSKTTDDSTEL